MSRRNALRHDLTAGDVLLPDEEESAFGHLRLALIEDLDPQSTYEAELALARARAFLRDLGKEDGLGRLSRYETALRRNLERAMERLRRAKEQ